MNKRSLRPRSVTIENFRMLYRNFSGKPSRYNKEGQQNFCAVITEEEAVQFDEIGFNVKRTKPRDDELQGSPYIKVNVNFNSNPPPRVVIVSQRGKTDLDENSVSILDWSEIQSADVTINPYFHPDNNGRCTAYLSRLFVQVIEDELEIKYADIDSLNDLKHEDEPPM